MRQLGHVEKVEWLNPILFLLFLLSGFCSLIYQVVWLRLAFAHFGIVTPVLSVVLSVFMLGLGAGSLLGGRLASTLSRRLGVSPAVLYGAAEVIIGLGALMVPAGFDLGEMLLFRVGAAGSISYLLLSAIAIGVVILPWSTMMGATFPLMMAFVRSQNRFQMQSFSFLYLANVIGAMLGALSGAMVLIELLGLRRTSLIAAALNACIAAASFMLARIRQTYVASLATLAPGASEARPTRWRELVLFTTGFCSLAMEVVWTRGFTIILLTTIYAFAAILATYLAATWVGSAVYRLSLRYARVFADEELLVLSAACALLPLVLDDPRVQSNSVTVLASVVPLCTTLGYLTPKLVDEYSAGDPRLAGRCYAINILGGILGPLFTGYVLVVIVGVRLAMVILALPLCMLAAVAVWRTVPTLSRATRLLPVAVLLIYGVTVSRSYEEWVGGSGTKEVHRDYAATAIAYGTGRTRALQVNGVAITILTPITKVMAHLPLALQGHAHDGLVICFGMGTTFRSMATWGINTTVVDLTRSVVDSFGFFHEDASAIMATPNVHVVIDDGRRFLQRTDQLFDVITIDPPPPVEAAGSSLLYSKEFYETAKRRLRPDGILQQWVPVNQTQTSEAIARSLMLSFPYVMAFRSIEGWGTHFLASVRPIRELTAEEFVARMPREAQLDLTEWGPANTPESMAKEILAQRVSMSDVVPSITGSSAITITDDRPFNEYFLLRRWLSAGS
jgi:predicted membrane-bound spermidine synthase